jgi:hypothetical protein
LLTVASGCDASSSSDGPADGDTAAEGGDEEASSEGSEAEADEGADDGPVECGDPAAAPLDCASFWSCFGSTPRECISIQCPRTESAAITSEAFSACLGEQCAGKDPSEQQACADDLCRLPLVDCIADGDEKTCWSYEACIQRECLPLRDADPPAEDDAVGECLDKCFDDHATAACRQCRGDANVGFLEEQCPDQLRAYRSCGSDSNCEDSDCVSERCPGPTEALGTCLDRQLEANPQALQDRLQPCYDQSS